MHGCIVEVCRRTLFKQSIFIVSQHIAQGVSELYQRTQIAYWAWRWISSHSFKDKRKQSGWPRQRALAKTTLNDEFFCGLLQSRWSDGIVKQEGRQRFNNINNKLIARKPWKIDKFINYSTSTLDSAKKIKKIQPSGRISTHAATTTATTRARMLLLLEALRFPTANVAFLPMLVAQERILQRFAVGSSEPCR